MPKMIAALVLVTALTQAPLTQTAHAADGKSKAPGIAVGKKAPDFELKDQLGKSKKLSTLLKKGTVAIVFHRSASW